MVTIIACITFGLWFYSSYLEFDPTFVTFSLKLIVFLFSVWSTVNARSMFSLLIS